MSVSRAHPRTRGRDSTSSAAPGPTPGSPPHAGKGLASPPSVPTLTGLTPARGEGTARSLGPWQGRRAHPRTRGRDDRMSSWRYDECGSPPHAGKGRGAGYRPEPHRGLTPARGEGTAATIRASNVTRAHPRTRGRDWPLGSAQAAPGGSPPHAGKGLRRRVRCCGKRGLTPARGEGTGPTTR